MPSVLVVDDTLFMRITIQKMFEQWGYDVVALAENGKQAVKMYEQHKPDLVTMDLTMPVMSGLEALKHIIQMDAKAKVIMITALGQKRYIIEAIESGAKDFVTKPFTAEHLKAVVDNIIEV